MAKTNKGLVEYAKAQLGRPYWYGCYGNTSTKSLYTSKKKQYPSQYNWVCQDKELNKKVHDCVGLIKGYLWCDSPEGKPKYKSSQDVSANGMLEKGCSSHGPIKTMPDIPGVLVFMDHHVGVYIGDGYVIEAKGHNFGVVKTKLEGRGWRNWGKCKWIEYSEPKKAVVTEPKKEEPKKATSTSFKGIVNTNSANLNVRSTPKITANNIVGKLAKGTTVTVLSTEGDWYKISFKGATRYVVKQYIKKA